MRSLLTGVLACLACVLAMCLSSVAGVALASGEVCPNAAVRTGVSAHLPSCRAYEMVTPVFKAGYPAFSVVNPSGAGAASSGEAYVFNEPGRFDGAPAEESSTSFYVSRRGSDGWRTVPIGAPPSAGYTLDLGREILFDPSLEEAASIVGLGENVGQATLSTPRAAVVLHSLTRGDEEEALYKATDVLYSQLGAPFEAVTPGSRILLDVEGASADLSHMVVEASTEGEPHGAPLLPADTSKVNELYDVSSSGLSLVGVDGEGKVLDPSCRMIVAGGRFGVSPAGSRVFFESNVNPESHGCSARGESSDNPRGLFVRVHDSKTLEVSRPEGRLECGAGVVGVSETCSGANRKTVRFEGANWDGSRVFFTTAGALVSGDTNTSSDLYMAKIGEEAGEPKVTELVQVSHDPREGSEAGEAQRVIAMSTDGSHVYYFAKGVLAGENAEHESPAASAENLYLYDANSGVTTFVADLCSGPESSGSVPDSRCGASLSGQEGYIPQPGTSNVRFYPINDSQFWSKGQLEAQVNECAEPASSVCEPGRFLVFTSYARLTPDDVNGARQVFRYDAKTGSIVRVSVGEDGYNHNGNQAFDVNDLFLEGVTSTVRRHLAGEFVANASIGEIASNSFGGGESEGSKRSEIEYEMLSRDIAQDGSRIVFKTDEPLSSLALNERPDIYEWHEDQATGKGVVRLVSSGTAEAQDGGATLSPSGRDLFFATTAGLVPQDTEGDTDIYDARIGGGFAQNEPSEPCAGDACQGALSTPAPLLIPGSVSQAAGGNYPAPPVVTVATKSTPKPKPKPKPKRKEKGKKHGKAKAKAKRGSSVGRKARRASKRVRGGGRS